MKYYWKIFLAWCSKFDIYTFQYDACHPLVVVSHVSGGGGFSQPPWMQTPPGGRPSPEADPLVMWPVMHAGKPSPPVNRMTHRCKNTTLPQTSFAGGKNKNLFACFILTWSPLLLDMIEFDRHVSLTQRHLHSHTHLNRHLVSAEVSMYRLILGQIHCLRTPISPLQSLQLPWKIIRGKQQELFRGKKWNEKHQWLENKIEVYFCWCVWRRHFSNIYQ